MTETSTDDSALRRGHGPRFLFRHRRGGGAGQRALLVRHQLLSGCCGDGAAVDCWGGLRRASAASLWVAEDFCCHALPPGYGKCYEGLEGREAGVLTTHADFYAYMASRPPELWLYACLHPASPLLWSRDCDCCEPPLPGRSEPQCAAGLAGLNGSGVSREHLHAHLEAASLDAGAVAVASLQRPFSSQGCLVSARRGEVATCDEAEACPTEDCAYMKAFKLALMVTTVGFDGVPVFTRVGTRWSNTVALPVEWQLHPAQCNRHVMDAVWAKLVWRGTASNCRTFRCRLTAAAEDAAELERCVRPPSSHTLGCEWNFTTFEEQLWMGRFVPWIDAKFVDYEPSSGRRWMAPDLQRFLVDESMLVSERMSVKDQGGYKYAIAVEGFAAADRVYWQLFTSSVVLVPDGPWQVFAVHAMLEPYVHYVPVRYDLADLAEKVEWLRRRDEEAKQIAGNARAFALRYLTCDSVVYFVDRLLRAYAGRLCLMASQAATTELASAAGSDTATLADDRSVCAIAEADSDGAILVESDDTPAPQPDTVPQPETVPYFAPGETPTDSPPLVPPESQYTDAQRPSPLSPLSQGIVESLSQKVLDDKVREEKAGEIDRFNDQSFQVLMQASRDEAARKGIPFDDGSCPPCPLARPSDWVDDDDSRPLVTGKGKGSGGSRGDRRRPLAPDGAAPDGSLSQAAAAEPRASGEATAASGDAAAGPQDGAAGVKSPRAKARKIDNTSSEERPTALETPPKQERPSVMATAPLINNAGSAAMAPKSKKAQDDDEDDEADQADYIDYTTAPLHESKMSKTGVEKYAALIRETRTVACKLYPVETKAREKTKWAEDLFGKAKSGDCSNDDEDDDDEPKKPNSKKTQINAGVARVLAKEGPHTKPTPVKSKDGKLCSRSGLEILHSADGWHFGWAGHYIRAIKEPSEPLLVAKWPDGYKWCIPNTSADMQEKPVDKTNCILWRGTDPRSQKPLQAIEISHANKGKWFAIRAQPDTQVWQIQGYGEHNRQAVLKLVLEAAEKYSKQEWEKEHMEKAKQELLKELPDTDAKKAIATRRAKAAAMKRPAASKPPPGPEVSEVEGDDDPNAKKKPAAVGKPPSKSGTKRPSAVAVTEGVGTGAVTPSPKKPKVKSPSAAAPPTAKPIVKPSQPVPVAAASPAAKPKNKFCPGDASPGSESSW
ncbi:unnamed protein product [Prorocentrum cordatum]|uniref:FHA domain-containing protein n=1 Tax=Prorocentrum cordatum TaxID=2364126 RepID=A0ABN9V617_9DINO|nr:unnamed protein product [Polarella glacialis]